MLKEWMIKKVKKFWSSPIILINIYYIINNINNILGWQLNNCGFFLENQRQFFHGTK